MAPGDWDCVVTDSPALFAVYAGLTASGYDLVGTELGDPLDELVGRLRSAPWPPSVREYFAAARRGGGGVNPYWPRAYLLALTALHLEDAAPWALREAAAFRDQVAGLAVDPAERGSAAMAWLERLPGVVANIMSAPFVAPLRAEYLTIVAERAPSFDAAAGTAVAAVSDRLGVAAGRLPGLTLLSNPLQAREETDFIPLHGRIFVIMADADAASIAHELLHHVLGPRLAACDQVVIGHRGLLAPVIERMRAFDYAWADDEASWRRVLEESLVRAATLWVMEGAGDPAPRRGRALESARAEAEQGFAYVLPLLEHFERAWAGLEGFEEFVRGGLERCRHFQR